MKIDQFYDLFTGRCIREIKFAGAEENAVYLTFDDGPDQECTLKVLEVLDKYHIKATFFVIATRVAQFPKILERLKSGGHAIGNHSFDHDVKNYFKDAANLNEWIEKAEVIIKDKTESNSIGFRSPIGIKTPSLNKVLNNRRLPLILWNIRFFDTKYGLSQTAVQKKLPDITGGSIILLHDTHKGSTQKEFIESLELLILECQKKKLQFRPLTKDLVLKSYEEKYEAFK